MQNRLISNAFCIHHILIRLLYLAKENAMAPSVGAASSLSNVSPNNSSETKVGIPNKNVSGSRGIIPLFFTLSHNPSPAWQVQFTRSDEINF